MWPRPPDGEANCLYAADGTYQSALPVLGAPGRLIELTPAMLTDGPWCGAGDTRYDADLLRVRRMRVSVRLQAGDAAARGTDPARFANPGSARRSALFVPDVTGGDRRRAAQPEARVGRSDEPEAPVVQRDRERAPDCADSYISVLRAHASVPQPWSRSRRRSPADTGMGSRLLHRGRGAGRGSGRTARAAGLDPGPSRRPSIERVARGRSPVPRPWQVARCFYVAAARSVFERLARESASSAVPARRTLAWHPYLWSSWNALVGEPGRANSS